ncbi:hypothetical protein Cni_G06111 [Canna indica]|uniref:Uncharacterized protein n=1 Tax=Canna indica TaxID=4628 RepID=A0AAQ3Q4F5_9LILI|nr:hypothetical protein Cni_G06111 [Canna indica]
MNGLDLSRSESNDLNRGQGRCGVFSFKQKNDPTTNGSIEVDGARSHEPTSEAGEEELELKGASLGEEIKCHEEPLARSRPETRTPRTVPENPRNVISNPRKPINPSMHQHSQKIPSKADHDVPKHLGSRKSSETINQDLLQRWNKSKPGSNCRYPCQKFDLEDGSKRKFDSCLASTPEKALLGFDTHVGLKSTNEGEEKIITTPVSANTLPVQTFVSPEVPMEASAVAATPVRFAVGHVIAVVHDKRKCRPRGILIVGENGMEIEDIHNAGADPTRVSFAPPPLAEADIHLLSSPSEKVSSGLNSSFDWSSKDHMLHRPIDVSVNWLYPPSENGGDVPKDEFLLQTRTHLDHEFSEFSPNNCSMVKSPKFRESLNINSPRLETMPSSGIGVQKTPSTGIAKTLKNKCLNPQQESEEHHYGSALESSPISGNSWIEDHTECSSLSYSTPSKKFNFVDLSMGKMTEVLENICLSPKPVHNDASLQSTINDEESSNCHEDDGVSFISNKFEYESSNSIIKNPNEQIIPSSFGSVEFVFEAKVSPQRPFSSAESINTEEGLVLDSSDDSDRTLFYKNHLYVV